MRADPSTETRRAARLPPASSGVPLMSSDSQQAASKIPDNNLNNNINPKRSVLTMHRTPSKSSSGHNANNNNNTGTAPTTPRLGYKASQATLSQGPPVPRSPRPVVKREAGSSESTTSSVASRRSSYVGPQLRPSSSMSTVSNARTEIQSGTQSLRVSRPSNESARRPSSPKFFHAADTKAAARRSLQPTIAGDVSQPQTPRLQSQPSKFFYASGATNPSQTHLSPRLPAAPPVIQQHQQQQVPIVSPHHLGSLGTSRNVKFIYANGTEEVLEPRRKNPSTSEGSSRPPSPNPYPLSPGPISKPSNSSASSVLSSPTQRGTSSAERRASVESKARHGRALSVGGNGAVQEVFMVPEALRSPVAPPRSTNGDESVPTANPMAMTLKMREELAANARRERKVMDLEISNASLLAINRTLERRMKKQTSELRRYRRLARSGELNPKSATKQEKSKASDGSTEIPEKEGLGNEDGRVENAVGEEEDDQEDDEEDEEEEEDSSSGDETKSYKGKRALVAADKEQVSAELQKHQALLDASAKTDALLVRCQFMIEEMMKEGKKALDYKIKASDVKLGGRILRSDDEEEDNDDGEGVGVFDGGNVTETEAEDDGVTEAEEEGETDDGDDDGDLDDEDEDEEDEDEDEGNMTETEDEL